MDMPNDTSPEAERILLEIYRKMPMSEKWRQLGQIYRTAKLLHATGVLARNPAATAADVHDAWLAATLDPSILKALKEARDGARG
jgi:hypothetical protein